MEVLTCAVAGEFSDKLGTWNFLAVATRSNFLFYFRVLTFLSLPVCRRGSRVRGRRLVRGGGERSVGPVPAPGGRAESGQVGAALPQRRGAAARGTPAAGIAEGAAARRQRTLWSQVRVHTFSYSLAMCRQFSLV